MNDRKLTTGFYRPTESYKSIPEHIAVCFEDDLTLVAVVGASDDDTDHVLESHQYAQLFAAAPETLQKLSHALARNAEQAATIARLTAANRSMQEDAVQNTYAFGQMLHANKEQAAEIEQIKEQVQETLDLLRTGCAPDAFNMDEKQWMSHKINRAASFLSAMLRGKK